MTFAITPDINFETTELLRNMRAEVRNFAQACGKKPAILAVSKNAKRIIERAVKINVARYFNLKELMGDFYVDGVKIVFTLKENVMEAF